MNRSRPVRPRVRLLTGFGGAPCLGWLALWLLSNACSSDHATQTQLLVKIDAEEAVRKELKLLKVELFTAGSTDETDPVDQIAFPLTRGTPHDALQRIPFSFGITQGASERIELVVKGYTSDAKDEPVVIERKAVTNFRSGATAWVQFYLYDSCYSQPRECSGLDRTCVPPASSDPDAVGLCGAVDEIDATEKEPQGPPPLDVVAESGGCEDARLCIQPDYVCVDSTTSGYECRGQFAEWPMPRDDPDSPWQPHYTTDSASETVRDDVTGLIWQRLLPDRYPSCTGTRVGSSSGCSWDESKKYCDDLELASETDWRLPTKIELESLISDDSSVPAFDSAFPFAITSGAQELTFWSTSPVVNDDEPGKAWFVDFGFGLSDYEDAKKPHLVRCVRSVTTRTGTPADRYKLDREADTVTDQRTKLIWQRSLGATFENHAEAEAYCQDRGARLPSRRELLTLIDPSRPPPAIDPLFPDIPKAGFWTSTPSPLTPMQEAWYVVFLKIAFTSDNVVSARQLAMLAPSQPELRLVYTRCVQDDMGN
jgi:hypothetical protein